MDKTTERLEPKQPKRLEDLPVNPGQAAEVTGGGVIIEEIRCRKAGGE